MDVRKPGREITFYPPIVHVYMDANRFLHDRACIQVHAADLMMFCELRPFVVAYTV